MRSETKGEFDPGEVGRYQRWAWGCAPPRRVCNFGVRGLGEVFPKRVSQEQISFWELGVYTPPKEKTCPCLEDRHVQNIKLSTWLGRHWSQPIYLTESMKYTQTDSEVNEEYFTWLTRN